MPNRFRSENSGRAVQTHEVSSNGAAFNSSSICMVLGPRGRESTGLMTSTHKLPSLGARAIKFAEVGQGVLGGFRVHLLQKSMFKSACTCYRVKWVNTLSGCRCGCTSARPLSCARVHACT